MPFKNFIFLFLVFLQFPTLVLANPAPMGGPGKTPIPSHLKKSEVISLVREKVVMTDGVFKKVPSFIPHETMKLVGVQYDCEYLLRNDTALPQSVEIAFPMVEGSSGAGLFYGTIDDFRVSVGKKTLKTETEESRPRGVFFKKHLLYDGLTVQSLEILFKKGFAREYGNDSALIDMTALGDTPEKVNHALSQIKSLSQDQKNLLQGKIKKRLAHDDDFGLDASIVWKKFTIHFEPMESVSLNISYRSYQEWEERNHMGFAYILKTGALWKGPIEEAIFIIRFAKYLHLQDYQISPRHYQVAPDQRSVQFRFLNFEPKENIEVKIQRK